MEEAHTAELRCSLQYKVERKEGSGKDEIPRKVTIFHTALQERIRQIQSKQSALLRGSLVLRVMMFTRTCGLFGSYSCGES